MTNGLQRLLPVLGVTLGLAAATPALANDYTLCPASGSVGGIAQSSSTVAGPLDGSCGANSAVQVSINNSANYGKLTFDTSTPGYPPGLSLGTLNGISSDVVFTGTALPYYMLAFTDSSGSLGQTSASDQILMIEFQSPTIVGTTMTLDTSATMFNLYDNTMGFYLQGGQSTTNSVAGWLSTYPALSGDSVDEIRIGMGLAGSGDENTSTMTVNSVTVDAPEPASMALLGFGIAGLGALRRRRG